MSMECGIERITRNDLCISCGMCAHACPAGVISMRFNESKGQFEPDITTCEPCGSCTSHECLACCPGNAIDFPALLPTVQNVTELGPCTAIYTGYACNPDVRRRASSGGIIRSLCAYILERKAAKGVIALAVNAHRCHYQPRLLTQKDINDMPGSLYHNVCFADAVPALKEAAGPVAVVALPCQLAGLMLYLRDRDALKKKIACSIGLICGWMYSWHALWAFCAYNRIDAQEIECVAYRGGGRIGALRIGTAGGMREFSRRPRPWHGMHYLNYRTAFSRTFNLKRCHVCMDHLNYAADIAVGDAWIGRFRGDADGTSLIISRTQRGDTILRDAAAARILSLSAADAADVVEAQSDDFAFGASAARYIKECMRKGKCAPCFTVWPPVEARRRGIRTKSRYDAFTQRFMRSCARQGRYGLLRFIKFVLLIGEIANPWLIMRRIAVLSLTIRRRRQ